MQRKATPPRMPPAIAPAWEDVDDAEDGVALADEKFVAWELGTSADDEVDANVVETVLKDTVLDGGPGRKIEGNISGGGGVGVPDCNDSLSPIFSVVYTWLEPCDC